MSLLIAPARTYLNPANAGAVLLSADATTIATMTTTTTTITTGSGWVTVRE
ncbi:hypothetical protein [Dyella sp. C11]|uniref:hypothetical protein n=1 Tax=Dyella sp. C11 TaxID=2126991 RepID=UPI001300ACD6|nr:hypothetical protein [Dyella sp. C11]